MNPRHDTYEFRGRNDRVKFVKCVLTIVVLFVFVYAMNKDYIHYLCSRNNCQFFTGILMEYDSSGRQIGGYYLVEYQNHEGKRLDVVESCLGDKVGNEVVIAVDEGEILRLYPTVRGIMAIVLAVIVSFTEIRIQYQKRQKKKNAVDAQVIEKKQKICDGKLKEYVICRYTDEKGNEYTYQSEMVPYRINLKVGDMVEVAVDPYDLNSYFVQLDGSAVSYRRL